MANDRPPHGHPLALTAGELLRLAVEKLVEVQNARRLVHALGDLGLAELTHAQGKGDVLAHGHVRVEGVVLKDHGHVSLARRNVVDDLTVKTNLASGHGLEPGDQPQQGGLAATRRPDEHDELAVVDFKVHVVDGHRAVGKDLPDSAQPDRAHRDSPPSIDTPRRIDRTSAPHYRRQPTV